MSTKKVKGEEKTFDEKLEEIKFDDKTIADVYEAQVVLALKLDQLIGIMTKIADYTESRRTGTAGIAGV